MLINLKNILVIQDTLLYQIYIKGLYFKIMLFFLFFSYIGNDFPFFIIGISFIIINGMIENGKYLFKSLGIFIGLYFSGIFIYYKSIPEIKMLIFIISSLFIVPIIAYYQELIIKYILKTLKYIAKIMGLFYNYIFVKPTVAVLVFLGNVFKYLFLWIFFTLLGLNIITLPAIFFSNIYTTLGGLYFRSIYGFILITYSIIFYLYLREKITKYIFSKIDDFLKLKNLKTIREYEIDIHNLWGEISGLGDLFKLNNLQEKEYDNLYLEIKKAKKNISKLNLGSVLKCIYIYYFIGLSLIAFVISRILILIYL